MVNSLNMHWCTKLAPVYERLETLTIHYRLRTSAINLPADCRAAGAGSAGSHQGGCLVTEGSSSCSCWSADARLEDWHQTWHIKKKKKSRSLKSRTWWFIRFDELIMFFLGSRIKMNGIFGAVTDAEGWGAAVAWDWHQVEKWADKVLPEDELRNEWMISHTLLETGFFIKGWISDREIFWCIIFYAVTSFFVLAEGPLNNLQTF